MYYKVHVNLVYDEYLLLYTLQENVSLTINFSDQKLLVL